MYVFSTYSLRILHEFPAYSLRILYVFSAKFHANRTRKRDQKGAKRNQTGALLRRLNRTHKEDQYLRFMLVTHNIIVNLS